MIKKRKRWLYGFKDGRFEIFYKRYNILQKILRIYRRIFSLDQIQIGSTGFILEKCWDRGLQKQTKDGLSGNLRGYSDGIFDFSILINKLDLTVSLVLKENENGNSILSKVNSGSLSKFVNRDVISNKKF